MAGPPQIGATRLPIFKFKAANFISQFFDSIICQINIDMRIKKTQVNAVEFNTVDFCSCCHLQHLIKINRRFRIGSFAYDTWPGSIVQFGKIIFWHK